MAAFHAVAGDAFMKADADKIVERAQTAVRTGATTKLEWKYCRGLTTMNLAACKDFIKAAERSYRTKFKLDREKLCLRALLVKRNEVLAMKDTAALGEEVL